MPGPYPWPRAWLASVPLQGEGWGWELGNSWAARLCYLGPPGAWWSWQPEVGGGRALACPAASASTRLLRQRPRAISSL